MKRILLPLLCYAFLLSSCGKYKERINELENEVEDLHMKLDNIQSLCSDGEDAVQELYHDKIDAFEFMIRCNTLFCDIESEASY